VAEIPLSVSEVHESELSMEKTIGEASNGQGVLCFLKKDVRALV
jgi:hypothetical protein